MTVSVHPRYLVARPLTDAQIESLLRRIDAAESVGDLLNVAIQGVFDALLDGCGLTQAGQRLDPTRYAIPQVQWTALMTAVTRRAQQWGVAAHFAIELPGVLPSAYDDPSVPEPVLTPADFRPESIQLSVTRDAADVIAAAEAHLAELAARFGATSPVYLGALRSWHQALAGIFTTALGSSVTVSRDGDLSLLVETAALSYGIVFHPQPCRCLVDGCTAVYRHGRWHSTTDSTMPHDHEHSYPPDGPEPGTWSQHS